MAHSVLHKADTRGKADFGWLKSSHTFSFGKYHNPERVHFGALRVLNDDSVNGGMGFAEHPHDNMEIISIPLDGALRHEDSMNNVAVIKSGEIQVMSAGTGIYHKEFNEHKNEPVSFLQIWLFPNQRNVTPRYQQIDYSSLMKANELSQILSPSADDEGVWIYQDAWFNLGTFQQGIQTNYQLKNKSNGLYVFILKGEVKVAGETLNSRDGIGLWETENVAFETITDAQILLMEVPMNY